MSLFIFCMNNRLILGCQLYTWPMKSSLLANSDIFARTYVLILIFIVNIQSIETKHQNHSHTDEALRIQN